MLKEQKEGKKEGDVLFIDEHFIYGYMASGIWFRIILTVREETCCHHYMGYSFRLAA